MKPDRLTIAKVFGMFSLSVGLIAASLAFCDEIHEAAKSGNLDEVKALAKANPDVFLSRDTNEESALFLAVLNGRKNVVEFLLTNKADVDATNNNGWTPLDCAALKGRKDLAELLIVNGANVIAQGSGVTTVHDPLHALWPNLYCKAASSL